MRKLEVKMLLKTYQNPTLVQKSSVSNAIEKAMHKREQQTENLIKPNIMNLTKPDIEIVKK